MTVPFFSIIVPIYNAEAYLRGCLHSLLGQSFDDYQVICLDDASTDRSVDICRSIIDSDERFTLITSNANTGVSVLRNTGIDLAQGEYVLFVDADDYLSPDALLTIHDNAVEGKADIIVFGGKSFPEETWADQDLNTRRITYTNQGIHALMEETGSRPFTWNKAYRRALLTEHACRFDERLTLGEDHAFQFTVFPNARIISYIPEMLYHYRQNNPHSSTANVSDDSEERLSAHIALSESAFNEWKKRDWLKDPHVQTILGNWIIGYLFNDIISHSRKSIRANADTVIKWIDDPSLKECDLSEHNQLELRCLRSLASLDLDAPKISVIMPIYNVENYLDQALDSIRRQTMAHFEVIMVDDGSTDNTINIAERYCTMDPRFHLKRQAHKYAGIARNVGMEQARGTYLMFLDGDDYFEYDLLESAYDRIRAFDADICAFRACRYDHRIEDVTGMEWSCDCSLVPQNKTFSRKTCPDNIFCFTISTPWSKMYKASFVKNRGLQFQGVRSANDVSFVLSALASANKIITLDKTLLTYRVNAGSSLQSTQSKNPFAFYHALTHTRDELIRLNVYTEVERAYHNFALDCCLYSLGTLKTYESFERLYTFLRETAFEELGLTNKHCDDFYVYTANNYERMRFILRNPPRSYLIEYPEFTSAPFLAHDAQPGRAERILEPIRRKMPETLKRPLGRFRRRMQGK